MSRQKVSEGIIAIVFTVMVVILFTLLVVFWNKVDPKQDVKTNESQKEPISQ